MDLTKFYSSNDYDYLTNEICHSKNVEQLNHVLKKILDFEEEILDYSEIPAILNRFSTLPMSVYKNPIYFILGYLAMTHEWSTIWKLESKLSKWFGFPLTSFHSIRYYRYLSNSK
jgi:hypothetical protein